MIALPPSTILPDKGYWDDAMSEYQVIFGASCFTFFLDDATEAASCVQRIQGKANREQTIIKVNFSGI